MRAYRGRSGLKGLLAPIFDVVLDTVGGAVHRRSAEVLKLVFS
jgi:hypothetical protein